MAPSDGIPPAEGSWWKRLSGEARAALVLSVVVLGYLAANDVTFNASSPSAPAPAQSEPDRFGALAACEEFVKQRLKAPASADFPCCASDFVTGGPSAFHVNSYVDAQKSVAPLVRPRLVRLYQLSNLLQGRK
jgi:hypothetical protein